ncbi:hypothetical protein Nepgr_028361 [Nepenthes gracilis]|uniref:Uncharacterized protein n=1 Tax=Nepenthes gracilis TaxID=150966 RepID=A0AAD3Y2C3_NEPGR|nr:hypothetical protein Nepgr_028361 [Nepenthes gracilis]
MSTSGRGVYPMKELPGFVKQSDDLLCLQWTLLTLQSHLRLSSPRQPRRRLLLGLSRLIFSVTSNATIFWLVGFNQNLLKNTVPCNFEAVYDGFYLNHGNASATQESKGLGSNFIYSSSTNNRDRIKSRASISVDFDPAYSGFSSGVCFFRYVEAERLQ